MIAGLPVDKQQLIRPEEYTMMIANKSQVVVDLHIMDKNENSIQKYIYTISQDI